MGKFKTREEFIADAIRVHGNKYDYSKVVYVDSRTKVCIVCPIHGEFWQKPNSHLMGNGCKKCAYDNLSLKRKKTTEQFIVEAKSVHGDRYDYSNVKYERNHNKVCIICPTHGEFWQMASDHLQGRGCPKCKGEKTSKIKTLTKEKFIEKAKKIHGDKYNYSKVEYVSTYKKICIICPKHGEFWQTPNVHLTNHGCPYCNSSRLENEIKILLDNNHIGYEYQKKFDWLGKKSLDFYIKEYNIAIECQGEQHFIDRGWSNRDNLKKIQNRDIEKNILCKKNNIDVIYYTNIKLDNYPYEIFKNKEILLEYIKNAKRTL